MQISKLLKALTMACLLRCSCQLVIHKLKKFIMDKLPPPLPRCTCGQNLFTIQADAGGFSAEERTLIVERNINDALMACSDRSRVVTVVTINGLPVIRVGGFHVVTVDSKTAESSTHQ